MDETELDRGRRLSRRRMARVSFGLLIAIAIAIVASLLLSPARSDIAAALSTASVVLVGLLTCFVSIVLGYLGLSMVENTFGKDR